MRLTPALLVPAALVVIAACGGKKDTGPTAPLLGWHAEEGWAGQCWFPADYENLGTTTRLESRQKSLEAMISQWRGERDDGVSFRSSSVEKLEIILLGRPTLIEEVSRQNAAHCRDAMASGVSTDKEIPSTLGDMTAWKSWFGPLNAKLNEGECKGGLEDTLFYYLEIDGGWQLDVPVCEGSLYLVRATKSDKYRIAEDGPWINADGDPNQPTSGVEGAPCNREGCYAGMVIMRFTTDSGIETIVPMGVQIMYTVPAHGRISVRVNDTTFYDNTWYQSGGIIDHTALEISPK
jgi:hypothetical protein